MAYFLNLFTPETWTGFQDHGAKVSGFRYRQRRMAKEEIHTGDIFLCYLVRLSRWCGVLKIVSEAYEDDELIFSNPDPFVIRFKVEPITILDPLHSIPMFEDDIWNALQETKGIEKGSKGWAKYYRGSLRRMVDTDGEFLLERLQAQASDQITFELTERDKRQLARKRTVKTFEGEVRVSVPDFDTDDEELSSGVPTEESTSEPRQSIQKQAKLAEIGIEMGFRIWVPKADRNRIYELIAENHQKAFVDDLPLNYDDTTLDTVAQIDVLWFKGRSIARAFEVEHTTAVYSGLLRMADLLALQPNMDIHDILILVVKRVENFFGNEFHEGSWQGKTQIQISQKLDQVIEMRFKGLGKWSDVPIHRVLLSLTRRRPRDLIKLLTSAAQEAFRKDSEIITTEHLRNVFEYYSRERLQDVINEFKSELPGIEHLVHGMKPTTKEKKEGLMYIYTQDRLIKKITNLMSQHKYTFTSGKHCSAKSLAEFLYKIDVITARKGRDEDGGKITRKYFEEHQSLLADFADYGFDWEVHMAYRWAMQPDNLDDIFRKFEVPET